MFGKDPDKRLIGEALGLNNYVSRELHVLAVISRSDLRLFATEDHSRLSAKHGDATHFLLHQVVQSHSACGMSKPIKLWQPRRSLSSDDAGTTILKYSCSTSKPIPAPYESVNASGGNQSLSFIPSLQSLCVKILAQYPNQLHTLDSTRLIYKAPEFEGDRDLLRELIPAYSADPPVPEKDILKTVDPRLWATLVQVYSGLPETYRTYTIPLADTHLPLLQEIPSTAYFSLLTILELQGCSELDDSTVLNLGQLHSLAVLDASSTALTSWGVKTLAKTLIKKPPSTSSTQPLTGPWGLRILSLRNCMKVTDDVSSILHQFPLLSVIGKLCA